MVEVGGKPVLEHLVDHLRSYGIHEIIVNLHHLPQPIYEYFGNRLLYFYEPKLLGEAATIRELSPWLGEEFVVMNGDTLTDVNINAMKASGGALVESWDVYYTGTKLFNQHGVGIIRAKFCDYWQDMGTPERLKKAREEYENNSYRNKE